jgi:hypothetical protein
LCTARRSAALAAFLALLATAVAACGSPSATTTSSPSPKHSSSAAITAVIKADWEKVFASSSDYCPKPSSTDGYFPAAQKVTLLENGQQFAATIEALAQSPLAKSTAAEVSAVNITSPTTATVTYSILLDKRLALANQTGQALRQGGLWKVSAQSFRVLLAVENAASSSPFASP